MADENTQLEDLESFRQRARAWLAENMPKSGESSDLEEWGSADSERTKMLQRKLFDGGFAGICYPKAYGGQGLSPEHQRAFNEECVGYEMPTMWNIPTLTIIAPTILNFGSEEQKQRYLTSILRGDEEWVQFLSEPTGGSDLAGTLTRATKDGDNWLLNGSKIWSSGAFRCDYALCLARTDWDAPKHAGLTMFMIKVHQPGITIDRIKQVGGSMEFCQEFFDDVPIPEKDILGGLNNGWSVASELLIHERTAVGGGSIYTSGPAMGGRRGLGPQLDLVELAKSTGQAADTSVRQLVAEAHVLGTVNGHLIQRVSQGMRTGHYTGPAAALLGVYGKDISVRRSEISFRIAGTAGVAWKKGERAAGRYGMQFIGRQASQMGGGTIEIQRNIISERMLGMPREFAADRGVAFNEVKHNKMPVRSQG